MKGDKDAVDIGRRLKGSKRQRGAQHPCNGPRPLPDLSADREPGIEDGRRAPKTTRLEQWTV